MVKLTDLEAQALNAWRDVNSEWVLPFDTISEWSGVPRYQTRRVVRALARKGVVELGTGFNDDGYIAGRGYGLTSAGRAALKNNEPPER